MRLAILWFTVCILAACGGGSGDTADLSPPTITVQPGPVVAYETQSPSFQITASTSHGKLSYQWLKNGVPIPGKTDSTLTLGALSTSDDQAQITVTVSNGASVTSTVATLTVKPAAPRIVTNPTPQSIDAGQTATFTVTADGLPPLSYQWYKNGTAIPDAVSTQYTTPVQAVADTGAIYSVQVSNSLANTVTGDDAGITVLDPNLKNLLISEVSVCVAYTDGCWFEIYNPTSQAIDLSQYKVRSTATSLSDSAVTTFNLPTFALGAGAYQVVSGNIIKDVNGKSIALAQRSSYIAMLNNNGYVPDWSAGGFIELLDGTGSHTVDFVKFGSSKQTPVTPDFWTGDALGLLPHSSGDYGKSVVRRYPINTNTRSSADWTLALWVTPGGRNDISPTAIDSDGDGIPRSSQSSGNTFGGLDIFAMGARKDKRDIFVEIDYMDSTDPGVIPRKESLQMVVDAFARHGIAIHFDAGTLFSPTFNPALFNLGQGDNKVPFEKCVTLDQTTCVNNITSRRSLYDWKQEFMDPRRRPIFHYLLMGYTQFDDARPLGSSGHGEINGNDLILTMGNWYFSTDTASRLQILINLQAATIMHELGHNLGLLHGGDENQNYKPNYTSTMNYLYQIPGLPQNLNDQYATERWLYHAKKITDRCTMQNSPCGANFVINYSDGSGTLLDETALLEKDNIGHGALAGAYADWDGSGTLTTGPIQLDLNSDGGSAGLGTLHDYNDWANLKLAFNRVAAGSFAVPLSAQRPLDPLLNDRQTSIAEDPPSQDLIDFIRSTR